VYSDKGDYDRAISDWKSALLMYPKLKEASIRQVL